MTGNLGTGAGGAAVRASRVVLPNDLSVRHFPPVEFPSEGPSLPSPFVSGVQCPEVNKGALGSRRGGGGRCLPGSAPSLRLGIPSSDRLVGPGSPSHQRCAENWDSWPLPSFRYLICHLLSVSSLLYDNVKTFLKSNECPPPPQLLIFSKCIVQHFTHSSRPRLRTFILVSSKSAPKLP